MTGARRLVAAPVTAAALFTVPVSAAGASPTVADPAAVVPRSGGRGVPVGPAAAAAAPVAHAAVQLNMMGVVSATPSSRQSAVNIAVSILNSNRFMAVSFNEICPEQVQKIQEQTGYRYRYYYAASYFAPRGAHGSATGCVKAGDSYTEYGNVVFQLFTTMTGSAHYYSSSDPANSSNTFIMRNVVCLKTGVYLLAYWGCSTHLSHIESYNSTQRPELLFVMIVARNDSFAMHAMGDLNTSRSKLEAYTDEGFREADTASPKRVTTDGGSAIDYIFGAAPSYVSGTQAPAPISPSDHHVVHGFYSTPL